MKFERENWREKKIKRVRDDYKWRRGRKKIKREEKKNLYQ
jgi:hypothetical protein